MSAVIPLRGVPTAAVRHISRPQPAVTVYGYLWSLRGHRICTHLRSKNVPYRYVNLDLVPEAEQRLRDRMPAGLRTPVVHIAPRWLTAPTIQDVDEALESQGRSGAA